MPMQSRLKTRKACALCHERKIRCDGAAPNCRNCLRAQAICRPHERRRRFTDRPSSSANADDHLSETARRLAWLEYEIQRVFGVDIRPMSTGTPLDCLSPNKRVERAEDDVRMGISNAAPSQTPHYRPSVSSNEEQPERPHDVDPNISLLVLNATGEVRYLGASSGSFLAKYIANVAQSSLSRNHRLCFSSEGRETPLVSNSNRDSVFIPTNWRTSETFPFLLRCYMRWVNSIYPLFSDDYITMLESFSSSSSLPEKNGDVAVIFYLVMSIGAIHSEQAHLLNDIQGDTGIPAYQDASSHGLSAETLYQNATTLLESQIKGLTPRINLVQILNLISIYASHRPSDNKQWHVGGIAMRLAIELGLHRHIDSWKFTADESELRRRVFWTTYAIEITLAFNLGRPASISFEDADVPFPKATEDMIMPVHHIRHRQIQEQMLFQVYRGRKDNAFPTTEARESVLSTLQKKLDRWHQDLHDLHSRSTSPYPVEYWDRLYYSTSAALCRPTPLLLQPGPHLYEQCFLFSGKVIDIYDKLIRQFRLPNSWMLLQGLTLSAVSMIVTARINVHALSRRVGIENLLDNLTTCVRKLYVVTAVMRERCPAFATNNLEDLIDKLSRDTVRHIISLTVNEGSTSTSLQNTPNHNAVLPATPSMPHLGPSGDEPSSPSVACVDHMQHDSNSLGSLMNAASGQQALHTSHPVIDPGLLGFDSDANWGLFDNLFETNELQAVLDLFSGEQNTHLFH
ncbi:hypothetical protein L228DRAFT_268457 [Xylona heveae TC161]|uniref:Zn(2)-C6 fungal-type domain-containing protein n=1 Tax=Xylona heveae (strain CBS 132557 / TC161) TaxID=1328760 RepID=A0A165GAG4_XYLHT|nr:hypothetical protein L228DRAFT_268457 [Xylona heveae TC161]KZF21948.1 hypothetical protein L228DRAFT_268457 [Xylona heveae TC161]